MLLTDNFYLNLYAKPCTLDEHYMHLIIQEAYLAQGFSKPNPLVGALLVDDNGNILGKGYHTKFGAPHAEVEAIHAAIEAHHSIENTTLYCTLEPCCHIDKKTPPCLPLILEKKIKRVVLGTLDPNPKVSGKSVEVLRAAGVKVTVGVLEVACRYLIREFIHQQKTNSPYLHLKIAQSLDGSHGATTGQTSHDRWMTNNVAKNYVHQLRAISDAVLVGGETLRCDKPQLTCRLAKYSDRADFKQPQKIVLTKKNDQLGCRDFEIFSNLEQLKHSRHQRILIEAGPKLMSTLLENKLFEEISIIVAPKLLGNVQKLKFVQEFNLQDAIDLSTGRLFNMHDNFLFHWIKE